MRLFTKLKKLFGYGWDLYKKHEEGMNYLIFGFLAFVLNYVLFLGLESLFHMHYMAALVVSWVLTVVFAYWTNRTFVFKSKKVNVLSMLKEFIAFIGARIATELLEVLLMHLLVERAGWNPDIVKLITQTAVIVANYILSKLWIFKEK